MGVRTTCLSLEDDDLPYIPTVTVGAGFKGRAVVTCDVLYECFTHFIGGRTLPCLEPICHACLRERPKRYEAYVSLVWFSGRKHEIVRLTKGAVFQLKAGLLGRSTMRGSVLQIERKTERNNGRLTTRVEPEMLEIARLPAAPELALHLARVWRIDGMEVNNDTRAYIASMAEFLEKAEQAGKANDAKEEKIG